MRELPSRRGQGRRIVAEHPDQIVPLAIHAGDLASTNAEYPTDWTCDESDVFWEDLEFQLNPVGRINRRGRNKHSVAGPMGRCGRRSPGPISCSGHPDGCQLRRASGNTGIHVHITWFDNRGPVRLALLISENHPEGPQLWYSTVDPQGQATWKTTNMNTCFGAASPGPRDLWSQKIPLAEMSNRSATHLRGMTIGLPPILM